MSATGLATGTALGAISAGMSARAMLYEQLVDSVYENALKWIVQVRYIRKKRYLLSPLQNIIGNLAKFEYLKLISYNLN